MKIFLRSIFCVFTFLLISISGLSAGDFYYYGDFKKSIKIYKISSKDTVFYAFHNPLKDSLKSYIDKSPEAKISLFKNNKECKIPLRQFFDYMFDQEYTYYHGLSNQVKIKLDVGGLEHYVIKSHFEDNFDRYTNEFKNARICVYSYNLQTQGSVPINNYYRAVEEGIYPCIYSDLGVDKDGKTVVEEKDKISFWYYILCVFIALILIGGLYKLLKMLGLNWCHIVAFITAALVSFILVSGLNIFAYSVLNWNSPIIIGLLGIYSLYLFYGITYKFLIKRFKK